MATDTEGLNWATDVSSSRRFTKDVICNLLVCLMIYLWPDLKTLKVEDNEVMKIYFEVFKYFNLSN